MTEEDKIISNVEKLMDQFFEKHNPTIKIEDPLFPQTLYHYTSQIGMSSIIENNSIWLTHFRFLNDDKEFLAGMDLSKKIIEDFIKKNKNEKSDIYENIPQFLEEEKENSYMLYFIGSFSEQGDLQNQFWRYADQNRGASLGFDKGNFMLNRSMFSILRVIYKEDEFKHKITGILNQHLNLYKSIINQRFKIDPLSIKECTFKNKFYIALLQELVYIIMILSICFKNKQWSLEKEWRLVKFIGGKFINPSELKFRNSNAKAIPYVENHFSPNIRLNTFTYGSNANDDDVKNLHLLLKAKTNNPLPNPKRSKHPKLNI